LESLNSIISSKQYHIFTNTGRKGGDIGLRFKKILYYAARWLPNNNYGLLWIFYLDGQTQKNKSMKIESPQEMLVILDILRNEKPVYFDPTNNEIATNMEIVGEAE